MTRSQPGEHGAASVNQANDAIEHLLLAQERDWKEGRCPSVEQIVTDQETAALTSEALLDLIQNEVFLRIDAGEQPHLEEYLLRFPDLADALKVQWLVNQMLEPDSAQQPGLQDSPTCAAGKLIGRYEIQAELGRGGIGVAYRAWDPQLKRSVAIKVLKGGRHASSQDLARFRLEAEAVARVRHRNVVQVFDVGESADEPYIAMEYCAEGSLADRLRGIPLPPLESARIVRQIADGVAAVHQVQVVHRDLKPGNVFLAADDMCRGTEDSTVKFASAASSARADQRTTLPAQPAVPKVSDFGLAKLLDSEDGQTRTGAVLGTPPYMAPEQAAGSSRETVGPLVDVYALGAILYECLTGRPPFRGATSAETLEQVCAQEPIPVRRLQPRVPVDLETITLHCLQKEPARRYASARAVAEDLERFLRGEPIQARRVGPWERTIRWCVRNPRTATLVGCVATLLILLAVGSSTAAIWLKQERDTAQLAERRALASERERRQELYRAYILEGRTSRLTTKAGHREYGLEAIRQILRSIPLDELTREQLDELRDEALASLARVDVRLHNTVRHPARSQLLFDLDLDESFQHVAYGNEHGGLTLCPLDPELPPAVHETVADVAGNGIDHRQFSPRGRWLVDQRFLALPGGKTQTRLRIWDVKTGELIVRKIHELGLHRGPIDHANRMYVPGDDDAIHVLQLPECEEVGRSPPRFDDDCRLALSPDGSMLLVWTSDQLAEIVEVPTWATTTKIREVTEVVSFDWAPTGDSVLLGTASGRLYRYSLRERRGNFLQGAHDSPVISVHISPDGGQFASYDFNRNCMVWSMAGDQKLFELEGKPIRFSADGRRLALCVNNEIHLRDLTGKPLISLHMPVDGCAFTPDGKWLVTGGDYGAAVLSAGGLRGGPVTLGLDPCGPVAIHPAGTEFVTFGLFSKLWRWPMKAVDSAQTQWQLGPAHRLDLGGLSGMTILEPQHQGRHAVWCPDGIHLVVGDFRNRRVVILHRDCTEPPRVLGELLNVHRVAISPDGKWVAAAARIYPRCKVWSLADGVEVLDEPEVQEVIFSPDGRYLATSNGSQIALRQLGTWQIERTWSSVNDDAWASAVAFQPAGRLMAYSPRKGLLELCDYETGEVAGRLTDPEGRVCNSLCFSPDGNRLAFTFNRGKGLGLWDLRELRQGLMELGLPSAGFPTRDVEPAEPMRLSANRGDELPEVSQWSRNWELLAQREALQGRLADAVQNITKALALLRGDSPLRERAWLHTRRGDYHALNQNEAAARSDWETALSIDRQDATAIRSLARLHLLGGAEHRDPERAVSLLAPLSYGADPDDEVTLLVGIAQYRLGNSAAAIPSLSRVTADRHAALGGYFLALARQQVGQTEEARAAYLRAVKSDEQQRPLLHPRQVEELDQVRRESQAGLGQ